MLGRLAPWRHVVVALVIVGCAALAFFGIVGAGGDRPERFDAKQVTVQPAGTDGLRIREVVDIDFGTHDRHGYERKIFNNYGVPAEITASSPDAPAQIDVQQIDRDRTRIRIGDPDTTISGQHRYVLSYSLPDARLFTGQLALDVIGDPDEPEKLQTSRFEVVVTGLALDDPLCNVGAYGDSGGCTLERDGDVYRVVISPLEAGEGITIGGRITGRTAVDVPAMPELAARRADRRVPLTATMIPVGVLGAGVVFVWSWRKGRNEVFAGGAAEAAYGSLPPPTPDGGHAGVATVMVADTQMDELATIEFVPPRGIEPWQGRVLLTERIDNDSVAAWFSALAAREAITLERDDGDLVIGSGPRRDRLDPTTAAHLDHILKGRSTLRLGTYDKKFATTWNKIRREQDEMIRTSGWWKHMPPSSANNIGGARSLWVIAVVFGMVIFGIGGLVTALLGVFSRWPLALLFGLVVPAFFAYSLYRTLQPSRSATGSALALRTESFRRFLAGSEGAHVEWAWKSGLVREYSAWAVALDAAEAWSRALVSAGVPIAESGMNAPLLVHTMSSSFRSTHTAPSSSGSGSSSSGSSGGFSGGSVGGGGGGGSSGSW